MALFFTGDRMVDLAAVCDAHWETDRLFLRFAGGTVVWLRDDAAKRVWAELQRMGGVKPVSVTPGGPVPA